MTAKKDVIIEAEGTITTHSKGNTEMNADAAYKMKAKGMTMESTASGEIKASNGLTIIGKPIDLNPNQN